MKRKVLIPLSTEELLKLVKSDLSNNDCYRFQSAVFEKNLLEILNGKIGLPEGSLPIIGMDKVNGVELDLMKDYKDISSFLSIRSDTYLVEAFIRSNETASLDFFKIGSLQRAFDEADKFNDDSELSFLYDELSDSIDASNILNSLIFITDLSLKDVKRVLKINTDWDGEEDIKALTIEELKSASFFS